MITVRFIVFVLIVSLGPSSVQWNTEKKLGSIQRVLWCRFMGRTTWGNLHLCIAVYFLCKKRDSRHSSVTHFTHSGPRVPKVAHGASTSAGLLLFYSHFLWAVSNSVISNKVWLPVVLFNISYLELTKLRRSQEGINWTTIGNNLAQNYIIPVIV